MLRITGGKFRGRTIEKPKTRDIRPTTALVRESVFNQLQTRVVGSRFLDCFAGTGMMGIEALSREARFVLALEKERAHYRIMLRNFEIFVNDESIAKPAQKDAIEVFSQPNKKEPFDIAYIDPPYGFENMEAFVENLVTNGWMTPDGIIFVEQGIRDAALPGFEHREYGDTRLSMRSLG